MPKSPIAGSGPVEPLGLERLNVGVVLPRRDGGLGLGEVNLGGVHKMKVVVPPGVETLPQDSDLGDLGKPHPEFRGEFPGKSVLGLVDFKT